MQNFKQLSVIEFEGQRVLTTRQLALCYETTRHVISNNFTRNKVRYAAGKHYVLLEGVQLQDFKRCHQFDDSMKKVSVLYLWTEKGALLHAKSLNTDKAWEVYEYLVDFYFRVKEKQIVPADDTTCKPKQEAKPPVRLVVNVPDDPKAQDMIKEVKKALGAVEVMLDESNRYVSDDVFKERMIGIDNAFHALMIRVTMYLDLKPKMIQKLY